MNRILRNISLSLMLLMVALPLAAQKKEDKVSIFKYGVKGGIDFISLNKFEVGAIPETISTYTGFTAGIAFSFDLPVQGMTLQPELNYVSKGARIKGQRSTTNLRLDYIELPVNLQVGLDLILMRPYLMVSPYIGCAVYRQPANLSWDYLKRFEYGIGIGGGIDVWRLQLQVKYNWNIGGMVKSKEGTSGSITIDTESRLNSIKESNLRGLEVNLVFFF